MGQLFLLRHRKNGLRRERQPDISFEVFVIIFAANIAGMLIEFFHDKLEIMKGLKGDFGTRL